MFALYIEIFYKNIHPLAPQLFKKIDGSPIVYAYYALLAYKLNEPLEMDELMDILEDDLQLQFLYHYTPSPPSNAISCICAYNTPHKEMMYKFNAVANKDGMVEYLYVMIFDSVDIMMDYLKQDLELHNTYYGINKVVYRWQQRERFYKQHR